MRKLIFKGCCTALITPFDKNNHINYFELKNLIEFQIASGVGAILILGTTGESPTISLDERTKMIRFCESIIAGRSKLIVGCGSNSTEIAISHLFEAKNLGADAGLVVTPYYNKCNQKGIFEHYKKLSDSVDFPIIVYNVPSRTGVNILPETALKLSKLKNIVGIKEASSNMSQIAKLLNVLPNDFAVYCGDDMLTLPMLSMGAKGVISVTSNIYPEKVSMLCDYAFKGDYFNAKRIHNMLFSVSEALFLDVNPICIKEYMNIAGFDVGKPRLPLCCASKKIKNKLKKVFDCYEN